MSLMLDALAELAAAEEPTLLIFLGDLIQHQFGWRMLPRRPRRCGPSTVHSRWSPAITTFTWLNRHLVCKRPYKPDAFPSGLRRRLWDDPGLQSSWICLPRDRRVAGTNGWTSPPTPSRSTIAPRISTPHKPS